jgi:hypothetical protein
MQLSNSHCSGSSRRRHYSRLLQVMASAYVHLCLGGKLLLNPAVVGISICEEVHSPNKHFNAVPPSSLVELGRNNSRTLHKPRKTPVPVESPKSTEVWCPGP